MAFINQKGPEDTDFCFSGGSQKSRFEFSVTPKKGISKLLKLGVLPERHVVDNEVETVDHWRVRDVL